MFLVEVGSKGEPFEEEGLWEKLHHGIAYSSYELIFGWPRYVGRRGQDAEIQQHLSRIEYP
jgi:hypothetical protein